MSSFRMLGLLSSVSSSVDSSFSPWLRITFGSPKLEPTTPQNLTKVVRQSLCLDDRFPKTVGGLAEGVHDLVEAGAEHELAAVIHQVQPGEAAAVQVLLVELLHHLVEGAGVVLAQVAGGAQLLLLGLLRRGLASVGRRGGTLARDSAPAGN